MKKFLLILTSLFLYSLQLLHAQNYTVSGTVLDQETKEPVEHAVVTIPEAELWAVTDAQGVFTIKSTPLGKVSIIISSLGYAQRKYDYTTSRDLGNLKFYIKKDNLALQEVEILAQRKSDEATTTYKIERTALDHAQIVSVADINALLPGGKTSTKENSLIEAERFSLRSDGANEMGNTTFGTAVEIDGLRLSSNSMSFGNSLDPTKDRSKNSFGVDTRSISSSNIESVEIIMGVPSVEYGDLTNGVVKINTKKGRTPLTAEIVTKPKIKQYSLAKGFGLGEKGGVINVSAERTKSVSDIASPYTSYDRNGVSLNYINTFNKSSQKPLTLDFVLAGNLGGYDSKNDPDLTNDDYYKESDDFFRTSLNLKWALNKPWLTNLEWISGVNYNSQIKERQYLVSSTSSIPAIHTMEDGYLMGDFYENNPNAEIILVNSGYRNILGYDESKQLAYSSKLKATLAKRFSNINSRTLVGVEYSGSQNKGRGLYYADMSKAPDWRPYDYRDIPAENLLAIYAQEQIDIPIQKTNLQLIAGFRSDITMISGSDYGTVNSLSPRFNLKYNIPRSKKDIFRNIVIRGGWGKAVKLPNMGILYPQMTYEDINVFASPTIGTDNRAYHAYYTKLGKMQYNKNLKWQEEILKEVGLDFEIKGIKVSLSYFDNKSVNPYIIQTDYTPFSIQYTGMEALNNVTIPLENQIYSIDKNTGLVTVSDKIGVNQSVVLDSKEKGLFVKNSYATNGSSSVRRGFEWTVDFGKIPVLRTSLIWDGKYYYYKGVEENIVSKNMNSNSLLDNSQAHNYIAYYIGNAGWKNGGISKSLNSNLTIKTHIPEIKLIVTLRLEASLYKYSRNLSEYNGENIGFVVDNKGDKFPSETVANVHDGNNFIAVYPLYYTSYQDMDTKIPFAEAFKKAKESGDKDLYNALANMVIGSPYIYSFNTSKITPYFTANFAVTKEIGKYASVTFVANNFLNTLANIKDKGTDVEGSLFDSRYVPNFYYGLSLKVTI